MPPCQRCTSLDLSLAPILTSHVFACGYGCINVRLCHMSTHKGPCECFPPLQQLYHLLCLILPSCFVPRLWCSNLPALCTPFISDCFYPQSHTGHSSLPPSLLPLIPPVFHSAANYSLCLMIWLTIEDLCCLRPLFINTRWFKDWLIDRWWILGMPFVLRTCHC